MCSVREGVMPQTLVVMLMTQMQEEEVADLCLLN